ncbi:Primase C terminal 1 (PriCT-1) [Paenibacillus sp. UNC496MF]|uniref:primase C-terminal domain-containing protein n=1 Tax=Paenibacillus sp. UNC496MF TaxID=1502753 RepID=UPI0008E7BBAF|nr:primase C-terminal domain-containing protein [Paenibacillus sp. UNC496MF]SFJ65593.1 Primase C terminal 1 (PriCT-1) [Paenibacillus sp. UNC496MF]
MDQVFIECGADLPWNRDPKFQFTRKHFMPVEYAEQFRKQYNNAGVYETVMRYINPIWMHNSRGKWIINAPDSLKYGDFYLDFDYPLESDDDFDKIRSDVQTAIRYLKVILSVDPTQINLFFSGSKGIHLTVDAQVLGLTPHVSLNKIYKDIATDIAKYTLFKTLDVKIYDDKRMFRMINTWNYKGQRFKIPITYEELCKLSLEEIRFLAQFPREIQKPTTITSPKAKLALDKYIEKWSQAATRRKEFSGKLMKLEKLPACISTMFEKIFRETIDERNNSATALTSFLMQRGTEREEALARMVQWGEENCVPPLRSNDIEVVVNSVYDGQYRYGCETYHRLSGVCEGETCPLFRKPAAKPTRR